LSDALILLTGDDRDQEQAGEEEASQSASHTGTDTNHRIGLSKAKDYELDRRSCDIFENTSIADR
jgi:hypothetical protein